MEPTLLTAQQIAVETQLPVTVVAELLQGSPLVTFDDSTGDRKYNELDVLRVQIGCRMLNSGVRWPLVHGCLEEMAYLSWDELQEALRSWAPIHPKTQARMAITITRSWSRRSSSAWRWVNSCDPSASRDATNEANVPPSVGRPTCRRATTNT